jgi:autotransporter-associated beta strand protein
VNGVGASAISVANDVGTTTINATLAGSAGLTKSGNGTLVLGGSNSYSGGTVISGGTIQVGSNAALGNSTSGLTFAVGSGNTTLQAFANLTLGSTRTVAINSSTAGFDTQGFTLTVNSTIGGGGALEKTGSGTLVLNGNNTYSGGTRINAGYITVSGGSALSDSGSVTLANTAGTGFNVNTSESIGSLIGGGTTGGTITIASGQTLTVNEAFTNTFAGAVTGSGGLTKAGVGTLTLNGSNTYTGSTTINAGTLVLSSSLNGSNVTVSGVLNQSASGSIGGSGNTVSVTGGTATLNGNNTYTGGTTLSSGQLNLNHTNAIGNGGLTLSGGTLDNTSGSAITLATNNTQNWNGNFTFAGSSDLNLGSGAVTMNASRTVTVTAGNLTVGGAISGVGFGLTKNGNGTLVLAGANTYNGTTTLNTGTLNINNANAIGSGLLVISGTSTINNNSGAAITLATNNAQNWNATSFTFVGTNDLNLGTGNVTMTSNRTVTVAAGNLTVGGAISGAGFALTKNGNGTLVLAGANTYNGGTTLSAGTLTLNNANAIGAGTLTINGGAINNTSGAAITLATNNAQNWNSNFTFAGTNDLNLGNGAVTMNASRTVTVSAGNLTVGGAIAGTGFGLTKNGSGALILSGNNTYTGATTINAGTLEIGNTGRLGGGNYSANIVNSGTFIYSGTSNQTLSGIISSTGALTQNGSGTLILAGNNTYTGATTINAGNISINLISALGSTSGVNLANATALLYTGGAATLDRTITVTSGTGTIRNTGAGLLTLSGSIVKNATTLTFDTGSFNVTGIISGSSANSDLVVDGASVTLNNANTYNGPTRIIDGGTLTANVSDALPTVNRTAVTMDATGSGNSTLALGASQSIASLTGNTTSTVTLGSNTLTIGTTNGTTTTYAGRITGSNSSALVKDGASTQVLSGNNSAFTGTTTINSGTFAATSSNALGGTSQIIVNNSGSFLVTAENAVNDNANVTLAGGTLAVNGTFNENVGLLTLSANSTLDFSGFVGTLRFSGVGSWASGTNLAIWNWSGTPRYGDPVNNYQTPSNLVFSTVTSNLTDNLANISFYSDSVNSFVGNGFEVSGFSGGGSEIIAVPEPATLVYAIVLLAGSILQHIRCRSKRRSLKA